MGTRTSYILKSLLALLAAVTCATTACAASRSAIWFSPDGETPDFVELFTKPDLWAKARGRIDVFKFGPNRIDSLAGPKQNSFTDLTNANAFQRLKEWGIRIAIEAPAIKEWDCTGVQAAKVTARYIKDLRKVGGLVDFVAMDEPLVSGTGRCHLTVEQIAAKAATYRLNILAAMEAQSPSGTIAIGDIEPYPFYSVDLLKRWIKTLAKNRFKPNFFHLDVDLNRLEKNRQIDVGSDLREFVRFFRAEAIPFGIIFWSGHDPESSDQAYYNHTLNWVKLVEAAIGKPEQSVFQSWVLRSSYTCSDGSKCDAKNPQCKLGDPSYCGLRSVPVNLPENDFHIFSHTRLINKSLKIFDDQ